MGDGVAETLMLRDFASAVRHGTAPDQDVYFGVELSITGIQAMRSSLAGSIPVDVPDLRRPDVRRAHVADEWFPICRSCNRQRTRPFPMRHSTSIEVGAMLSDTSPS